VDILGAIPTMEFFGVHLFFMFPLHRSIPITPIHRVIITQVIEFGFRDIGDIEKLPTVGKRFGFLVTGNGDTIDKET
jgi:hypothetical protein